MAEKSQLGTIIKYLEKMMDNANTEVNTRRFEVDHNGERVERCSVTYIPNEDAEQTGTFELKDTQTNEVYQFDDIDLIAMDIYELLQD